MTLDPLAAHALALALVALDQGARALRLALLARALGHPFSVRAALVTNVVGDAACAVTPMRLGGEPARLGVMLRHGLPATAAFVVVALEVVTMWPVILATIAGLALAFAPRWLGETAPVLAAGLGRLWGWFALAAVVSVAVWALARRSARAGPRLVRRPWRRVRVYWRRLPAGVLVASGLLAFVNLATRAAILPVLMAMRPDAPPLGPALLG
jgi:uncharacterized membrane protein YbhN (UPF0104 family)